MIKGLIYKASKHGPIIYTLYTAHSLGRDKVHCGNEVHVKSLKKYQTVTKPPRHTYNYI